MRYVPVPLVAHDPSDAQSSEILAPRSAIRPFRRVQVTLDPPPDADEMIVRCVQYAGDTEVARDELRISGDAPRGVLLTASSARTVAFLRDAAPKHTVGETTVRLEELGERATIDGHLFMLGAMKSGTSTLYAWLRQHPAIATNRVGKEPAFFSSDAAFRGHYDYASQYRFDPPRHRWALDGSTNYSKRSRFPGVPERLAQLPGEVRFLYLMRDPVDRVESHLAHNVAKGRWQVDGLDAHIEECIDVSRYSAQLDRYLPAFPDLRERLLLIDFLDVVQAPIETMRRVESFLGLDPHSYQDRGAKNVRKARDRDGVALTDDQNRWIWSELEAEQGELASRYGFVPREPWGLGPGS